MCLLRLLDLDCWMYVSAILAHLNFVWYQRFKGWCSLAVYSLPSSGLEITAYTASNQHPLANQKLHWLLHPNSHLPAHIACCFAASYQMPWIKKMNIESRWNQPWQDKFKPTGCCDAISWSMSSQVPQEKDGKGCGKSFSEEVSPRNLASRSCNAIALEIEFLQTCF